MSWIMPVVKLAALILKWLFERDKTKKKLKREAVEQVMKGIEDKDPSAITAGFDKVNK